MLPYNYVEYFKASQQDDLKFSPAATVDTSSTANTDYYYDDEEDPCEFCKRKSQKILFKDFCRNDMGRQITKKLFYL
jgi:hypothetical protein